MQRIGQKNGQQNVKREIKKQEAFPVWMMAPELQRIIWIPIVPTATGIQFSEYIRF